MARYLTPRRIALLAVIALYLDGHAADSARLSILNFVASHIHSPAGHRQHQTDELLSNLVNDIAGLSKPLRHLASDVPGRSVHDVFLGYLFGLTSLDSLQDFFETFCGRLCPPSPTTGPASITLSHGSPLGQYIRRCHVEFTRLQFADLQALWGAFVVYRAPSWDYWAQKNPGKASELMNQSATSDNRRSDAFPLQNGSSMRVNVSADDADTLLAFSVNHLQKLGTRIPPSLKSTLQQWIVDQSSDSGVQSLQHFLTFFEHWRSGQYTMALESLHQYFDYSLVAKGAGADGNLRVYYQYALLHLSVLHADFQCWEESVEAMEECIATGMYTVILQGQSGCPDSQTDLW